MIGCTPSSFSSTSAEVDRFFPLAGSPSLSKQDFAQLFRRVDVEGLPGGCVNGVGQRVQAGLSPPGDIVERQGNNPDAFLSILYNMAAKGISTS